METSSQVRNNRTQLLSMIAQCEDITRTNNRVHQLLTNVMHNPTNKDNPASLLKISGLNR